MKNRTRKMKQILVSKQGMTMVELLIAFTLLVLVISSFLPLFNATYKNIATAGNLANQSYEKMSRMERLISNKSKNISYYETAVDAVPVVLTVGDKSVSFDVEGKIIQSGTEHYGYYDEESDENKVGDRDGVSYVTFYAKSKSSKMICFPNSLTDDFLKQRIKVVAKGSDISFNDIARANGYNEGNIPDVNGKFFTVHYTPKTITEEQKRNPGKLPVVSDDLYTIRYIQDGNGSYIAEFEFYGGNDIISSEHSPLYICFDQTINTNTPSVKVEIGAPEMIMVGEKATDEGTGISNYYYYVTKGIDDYGKMDLIAKNMTTAPLVSAMNDVEWVEEGAGDDGDGGVNKYGYYVMGGDAGQVRRFWKNPDTGNYYWGGDNLVSYDRNANFYLNNGYETMQSELTTQAQFKTTFRSGGLVELNGRKINELFKSDKISLYKYQAITENYFTANVTAADRDRFSLTLAAVFKKNSNKYMYFGADSSASESEFFNLFSWLQTGDTKATKLNAEGYKAATNYEYGSDTSLVTITSVSPIQINSGAYKSQANSPYNTNVYPTESYTLYAGYIPAVIDIMGWKTKSGIGYTGWGHSSTLGIAYADRSGYESWVPTGKFCDINGTSSTLSTSLFSNLSYKKLLRWCNADEADHNTLYPSPSSKTYYYKAGKTENGINATGLAMQEQGMEFYLTNANEIDITVGYLSHPYAITVDDPETPTISGLTGSDYFFKNNNGAKGGAFNTAGKFDHSFYSGGLRDNVTILDVDSYHDDIKDATFSMAVGYTLSYIFSDFYYMTRLNMAFNTGIVYIRATGAGIEKDNAGDLSSGKGWSLGKESNVFHQFYGIDQYQNGSGEKTALGWDTGYHRAYFNISSKDDKEPQYNYSPTGPYNSSGQYVPESTNYGTKFGTNCHPMMQTECSCVAWGSTWDENPQAMWGTDNGSLFSWKYDQTEPKNSKITSVTKEFESYIWAERIGAPKPLTKDSNAKEFWDYTSVKDGTQNTYGFVSVLSEVKDVEYGSGTWVAVGTQSGKAPKDFCASNKCYTNGEAGSYINVKYCYDDTNDKYAWKAVCVSSSKRINFTNVTFSQGIWYAMGYVDENLNGVQDDSDNGVIFYSKDPANNWELCRTNKGDNTYNASNSYKTNAIYCETDGTRKSLNLKGVNSMASRG